MDDTIKNASGIFFVLGIIADLATVGLYLKNLYKGTIPFDITSAFPWISIIIVIFIFSFMLLTISKDSDYLAVIRFLFGCVYVIFGALILAVISNQFILEANYGIYEYFGYIVLILLISGLGLIINADDSSIYFSVPFMIVGLYIIILWFNLLWQHPKDVAFDLTFLGNLLLIAVPGIFIRICLEYDY